MESKRHSVSIRFSDKEYEALKARSEKSGLGIAAIVAFAVHKAYPESHDKRSIIRRKAYNFKGDAK